MGLAKSSLSLSHYSEPEGNEWPRAVMAPLPLHIQTLPTLCSTIPRMWAKPSQFRTVVSEF